MLPLRTCEGVALPDETTLSTELSHALILPEHIDEMQKCHAKHIHEMQKCHVAVLECQPEPNYNTRCPLIHKMHLRHVHVLLGNVALVDADRINLQVQGLVSVA